MTGTFHHLKFSPRDVLVGSFYFTLISIKLKIKQVNNNENLIEGLA